MENSIKSFFSTTINKYLAENTAARILARSLEKCGVGLLPLIDHCTIRTHDVEKRSQAFLEQGFTHDQSIGVLEFDSWWAKVYRIPGWPALFIDQAFSGKRGKDSVIPEWVDAHGDECFHHVAVVVEEIETAIQLLKLKNVEFAGTIVGDPETNLRQVFTTPEIKNGKAFTVLELIERHNGYTGFLPSQANGLMESTRLF
jgi:hypothetical protein